MALDAQKLWNGLGVPSWLKFIRTDSEKAVDFSDAAIFVDLPTSDPAVLGQLWNDLGTVKVSAGP